MRLPQNHSGVVILERDSNGVVYYSFSWIPKMKPFTLFIAWILIVTIGMAQLIFSSSTDHNREQENKQENDLTESLKKSSKARAIQRKPTKSKPFPSELYVIAKYKIFYQNKIQSCFTYFIKIIQCMKDDL